MEASVYFKPCGASGLYVTNHEYGVEVGITVIEVGEVKVKLSTCEFDCGGCSFADYDNHTCEIDEWLSAKDFNEAAEMARAIEQDERKADFDLPSYEELDREAWLELGIELGEIDTLLGEPLLIPIEQ